jgi:hypothetical protein
MARHHASSWTERTAAQHNAPPFGDIDGQFTRQAFHRPHTSLGVAGHWMYMAGVLGPLVIGELIVEMPKALRRGPHR